MALFYNPSWFVELEHLTLFLAKVPDPSKITTWADLAPYLIEEIAQLIREADGEYPSKPSSSEMMVENLLHPDLLIEMDHPPDPYALADLILEYPMYNNRINRLQRRIKADRLNPRRMPRDLLREVYDERSLRSILELL